MKALIFATAFVLTLITVDPFKYTTFSDVEAQSYCSNVGGELDVNGPIVICSKWTDGPSKNCGICSRTGVIQFWWDRKINIISFWGEGR
jgi:hypothetical protein